MPTQDRRSSRTAVRVIGFNRRRGLLAFAIGILGVAVGSAILAWPGIDVHVDTDLRAVTLVGFATILLVIGYRRGIRNGPALRLDSRGIIEDGRSGGSGVVFWPQVLGVAFMRHQGRATRLICYTGAQPDDGRPVAQPILGVATPGPERLDHARVGNGATILPLGRYAAGEADWQAAIGHYAPRGGALPEGLVLLARAPIDRRLLPIAWLLPGCLVSFLAVVGLGTTIALSPMDGAGPMPLIAALALVLLAGMLCLAWAGAIWFGVGTRVPRAIVERGGIRVLFSPIGLIPWTAIRAVHLRREEVTVDLMQVHPALLGARDGKPLDRNLDARGYRLRLPGLATPHAEILAHLRAVEPGIVPG